MKLTCTKENLAKGLQVVSHIASKNITLPILNNVLLKAHDGALELSATNLELAVISKVRGKVEKEGTFTVQAKLLTDFITLLPDERIEFDLQEHSLNIHAQNSQTVIRGMDASEFPLIPKVEKKNEYVCNISDLRSALSQVAIAVSNDESRPDISGALFSVKGKELTLVGTDSYRLAERVLPLESASDDADVIVPVKTIFELLRIIGDEQGEMTVIMGENQILFSFDATKLISRTIEGRFPDYTQIIPKSHKTHVTINIEELSKAIRTASLFCKSGVNDVTIQFIPDKKEVAISALNNQLGENTTVLKAKITCQNNDGVFNYRYLLDGLANIGTEEVELTIEDNASPGVLRPAGGKGYLYIIMPIKQ
ncbi:DNA polymerase III subunit beta [Patescibacteria group bacterium]